MLSKRPTVNRRVSESPTRETGIRKFPDISKDKNIFGGSTLLLFSCFIIVIAIVIVIVIVIVILLL